MNILEEITHEEDTITCSYTITKLADDTLYHYAEQLNCSENQALDMLIRYMGLTDNIYKFLNDIGQDFQVDAWI